MKYSTQTEVVRDLFIPLITDFLNQTISAAEFETSFLKTRSEYIDLDWDKALHDIFSEIFLDVDEYTTDPDPNFSQYEIDENELRKRCTKNLTRLKSRIDQLTSV
ncbi:MAG: colicin immunity domain-containing protein [Candidatus Melainabacteria bacterium]